MKIFIIWRITLIFIIIIKKSMIKQLKILDEQLNSNNLTRVPSSVNKSEKSLFRALSLAIYFNEDHIDEIIRILRLCLVSTCKVSTTSTSSFCPPQRKSRFLPKFSNNQEAIDMYFKDPDAHCFIYDHLQLASLAFLKRVLLFTVTKDGYLQQNLFTTCTQKTTDPPLMIARISSRFFCVQSQSTRSVMMFIKENIINQILNLEDKKTIDDIFFSSQNGEKVHKKSLSDCGEVNQFKLSSEQRKEQLYVSGQILNQPNREHYIHHSFTLEGYEDYIYNDYMMNEMKAQINQRYTGRLKFFDQNGNYGFIVVDGFGTDLFVHFDDIQKAGIGKQRLVNIRNSQHMRFEFTCLQYDGKYKKSKKAVDLKQIPNDY